MNELENLELKISKFLRYGVLLAGFLMLIGWLGTFQWEPSAFLSFKNYSESSFNDILTVVVMSGDWANLIAYAGLFLLISLPVIRVFLTMALFFKQRDFLLATIAFIVLVSLLISFAMGIKH